MKKLILLLSLFAIATLPLQAQNTITFDDQGYGNAQDLDNFTLTSNSQGFRFKCFSSSPGFEYRSTSNFCSYTGGAPVGTGSAQSAMTIATTDGAEIDLSSIDIINEFVCFSCCTLTVTLTGYKDGSAVSGATYTASNTGLSTTFDVSGDSDFDAIDSLRITASGGDLTGTLIDNIVWDAGSVSCSMTASMTSVNNVDCNGGSDGSLTVTQSSGTANFSYAWSNGATTSGSSASTNTITSLAAGTYTVTVTDNSGCTATASATVSQPGSPTVASAAVTSALDCNGDTDGQVTASATGGTTPYTYSWNTGETSAVETNLGAGTYSVTITDQNGCTDSASVTMTQPTALVASSAVTSALDCNGDTDGQVTASASGGTTPYTYSWNTGGTSALETGLAAGTYSVTITDQNGCTDSASVTMTQPTALVASSAVTSALDCNGDTDGQVTASATGGTTPYTYSWNTGGTSALETGLAAGTYSVTITDQNGCTDSASVTMTQPSALVASSAVTSALDCNGDTDGQVTASATGGTTPYTYSWNTGGTSALETGLGAGTYSVTITDQNGCTDSASVTLSQPTVLVASAAVSSNYNSSNISCNGASDGEAMATATGGTGSYTYSWNTGGTSVFESGLSAGTYSVTITDANGCTDSASITITEPTAISLSTTDTSVTCTGDSDGAIALTASGGTGTLSFLWSSGSTAQNLSGIAGGTYTVTVTDVNGCTETTSDVVNEAVSLLSLTSSVTNVTCNGESDGAVDLTVSGGQPNFTYLWSTGSTAQDISNRPAGTYTVTVTDDYGCEKTTNATVTEPAVLAPGTISTN